MELVEGGTLKDLTASGPVPTRKLLELATQIADGLAAAHAAGIVHRDLKPANVMVSKHGYAKILDFGLAKLVTPEDQEVSGLQTAAGDATRPGMVMGTVGYMSPEQAAGRAVDFRSDQFSFGSILYEMATGKRAFERGTTAETLTAIIREEPEPVSQLNARIPAPVRWIVERCLSKDPEDRFGTTKDLARDLAARPRSPLGGARSRRRRTRPRAAAAAVRRRRKPWPWLLAAAALAIADRDRRVRRWQEEPARVSRPPSASSPFSAARSIPRVSRRTARRFSIRRPGRDGPWRSSWPPRQPRVAAVRSEARGRLRRSRPRGKWPYRCNRHFAGPFERTACSPESASPGGERRARSRRTSTGPTGRRTASVSPSSGTSPGREPAGVRRSERCSYETSGWMSNLRDLAEAETPSPSWTTRHDRRRRRIGRDGGPRRQEEDA